MWLFGKKQTLAGSGMFNGFTDWHSHILPGVDDGLKTYDESLEALRAYEKLGIRRVWLTPHIMEDCPNDTSILRDRFSRLCDAWHGNVELRLASENMLDTLFDERLEAEDLLPIGDERRHLLLETSYFNPPLGMEAKLRRIMQHGFFPVLAHPERYAYMEKEDYRQLRESGVLFQVNFISLAGAYGERARKKAEWLLAEGLADMAGSDIHRLEYFIKYIESPMNGGRRIQDILKLAEVSAID